MTTVELDEKISTTEVEHQRLAAAMLAARAHFDRVQQERIRTIGKVAAIEVDALPDLSGIRARAVAARHTLEALEAEADTTRRALEALRRQRPAVTGRETAEHLTSLLELRPGLARRVDAAIELLLVEAEAYRAVAVEGNALAKLLGVGSQWSQDPGPFIVRRIITMMRALAPDEVPAVGKEWLVEESDAGMVRVQRNHAQQAQALAAKA